MNRYAVLIGVTLTGLSFYSVLPVACNELFTNACINIGNSEQQYALLPYLLGMLVFGLIFLAMGFKSVSLLSFSKAE